MKYFIVIVCINIFAIGEGSRNHNECPQQDILSSGECVAAGTLPCRNPCQDDSEVIIGAANCTVPYCCVNQKGFCVLKHPIEQEPNINVDAASIHLIFRAQLEEAKQRNRHEALYETEDEARSFYYRSYCPTFPFNCQDDLELDINVPPVDIPYCQRIPCSPENPFLETDYQNCLLQPGCYFDLDLFTYRQYAGQAILPGVPVCHLVIRNRAFHEKASQASNELSAWNPVLTSCVLSQYDREVYHGSVGCRILDYLIEYLGQTPKRAAWEGITARECLLIGGCWRWSQSDSFCAYPADPGARRNFQPSNAAEYNSEAPSFNDYGLPICHPLNAHDTPSGFLSDYHTCLASGCASNVDRQAIWNFLLHLGSGLQDFSFFPSYTQYSNMVYSGAARPDNYQNVLDRIRSRFPYTVLAIPNSPFSLNDSAPYPALAIPNFPFSIPNDSAFRNNTHSLHTPTLNVSLLRLPPPPPYPNPCPYDIEQMVFSGFPALSGSFAGCCNQPLCYIAKRDLLHSYSGVSSYLSHWNQWSDCSAQCDGGLQFRRRVCVGEYCDKNAILHQNRSCNEHECLPYFTWGPWSRCSVSCGEGNWTRSRACRVAGKCNEHSVEMESCRHRNDCPFLLSWSPWSECTGSCGKQMQRRTRTCQGVGRCSGRSEDFQQCRNDTLYPGCSHADNELYPVCCTFLYGGS